MVSSSSSDFSSERIGNHALTFSYGSRYTARNARHSNRPALQRATNARSVAAKSSGNYGNNKGNYGNYEVNYGNDESNYENDNGNYEIDRANYGIDKANYGIDICHYDNYNGNYGNNICHYDNYKGNYGNGEANNGNGEANNGNDRANYGIDGGNYGIDGGNYGNVIKVDDEVGKEVGDVEKNAPTAGAAEAFGTGCMVSEGCSSPSEGYALDELVWL